MRIIAGEARGRRLKTIKGTSTRPTLDRVKESIFNIIGFDIPGVTGLDLFAGFGNLGLEALSRGADRFIFVEKDYRNVKVIADNLEICGFSQRAEVKKEDVFTFLDYTDEEFGLILMDPPYGKDLANEALVSIIKNNIMERDGLIVVEHSKEDKINNYHELETIKARKYGDTVITILLRRGGE